MNLLTNFKSSEIYEILLGFVLNFLYTIYRYIPFPQFLPPARKLGQGNVFTGICLNRGGLPQYMLGYPPEQNPWEQSMLGDMVNEWAVCILLECNLV